MSENAAPLYDKPHSVDVAQVMLVFLYFMLVSSTLGLGPRLIRWAESQVADQSWVSELESVFPVGSSYPITVVLPAIVVLTIPYVVVVIQLGHGRKWARAAALLIAPLGAAAGIGSVARTFGTIPAVVIAPLWIAVAGSVMIGLATRTGRRWFRQGGWAPWYLRYEMDQLYQRRRRLTRRRRRTSVMDDDNAD